MRPLAVVVAAAVAAGCAGCARGRSDATAADARAACRAYYGAGPNAGGVASRDVDEVRRLAKPLRRSDYDRLGSELVRFVTHQGILRRHAEAGDGNALLREGEEMRRIMTAVDEECRALGASPRRDGQSLRTTI